MKLSRKFWIISILAVLGSMALIISKAIGKLGTKAMVWWFVGLVLLWVFVMFGKRVLNALLHRPVTQSFVPSLLPPRLENDKVMDGVVRYFTKRDNIPVTINMQTKERVYPYGAPQFRGEEFGYKPGRLNYDLFEMFFNSGDRRGKLFTVRVNANQEYQSVCNGTDVHRFECNIEEFKRRPREFPDEPIYDDKSRLLSQFAASMAASGDPDASRNQAQSLAFLMKQLDAPTQPPQVVGLPGDETDAETHKSNAYKPRKKQFKKRG
ncbi:MAG: hypothetical protein ABIG95_03900 [Candidatus Woesearchaeota archaeon]